MARKRASPTRPAPTPEAVDAALRAKDFPAAVAAARALADLAPGEENRRRLRRALAAAAAHHADRGAADAFAAAMADADALDPDDPGWAAERAALYAKGGNLPRALTLAATVADPALGSKLVAHAADRAVRSADRDCLPPELHPGFDAVRLAFREYEAGHDDAARDALQPVGLSSPFLEWKVFLRGLTAYSAGDDARAVENWQRLSPDRLPARLAAPLRSAIDPAFRTAQPADSAVTLRRQAEALAADPILDRLREIQRHLGREQPLAKVWKHAETLLPLLRRTRPGLEPRLSACLYRAVIRQGEQADVSKYRRLFGSPADDPHFHRLEALACEDTGNVEAAATHWLRYEAWLATDPPDWPPEVARRARALILHRVGRHAEQLAAAPDAPADLRAAFDSLFGPPKRSVARLKADEFYRRSAALAPDWPDPARRLFHHYRVKDDPARAEAVARELLARRPDDLPTLEGLAEMLQRQGRAAESLDLWRRVLAANPLDRRVRARVSHAYHAAARLALADGRPADADALLVAGQSVCADGFPIGYFALRAVTARKLGRREEADRLAAEAAAVPGGRPAAALFVAVDSGLAKLKPAEKTAANKALAAALAKPPTPLEVNLLYAAWDSYHLDGFTYRGQKTQEKKIQELAERCLTADAPAADFERLCGVLLARHLWKLALKVADRCDRRFPDNPTFKLALAECLHHQNPRYFEEIRIRDLLKEARELAERAADPRYRPLLDRIDELHKQYAAADSFFDFVFGNRR